MGWARRFVSECGAVPAVLGWGVLEGSACRASNACETARPWRFGDVRQPRVMERFTRCGSKALDSRALHCLLPSAMLR